MVCVWIGWKSLGIRSKLCYESFFLNLSECPYLCIKMQEYSIHRASLISFNMLTFPHSLTMQQLLHKPREVKTLIAFFRIQTSHVPTVSNFRKQHNTARNKPSLHTSPFFYLQLPLPHTSSFETRSHKSHCSLQTCNRLPSA
jgi:hypothetical protein